MISFIRIILILIVSNVSAGELSNLPTIDVKIGTFNLPPLYHTTKSGRASGDLIETIRVICKNARLNCKIDILPTARAYKSVEDGTTDMLLTAKHDRFKKCCNPTKWEYPWTGGIFSKKDVSTIPRNEKELLNKKLIVVMDWQAPYKVFKNLDKLVDSKKVVRYQPTSVYAAIKMLLKDRAEFLWGSDTFPWYFNKMSDNPPKINYRPLVKMPVLLWVSKKTQRTREILRRFDLSYLELKKANRLTKKHVLKKGELSKVFIDADFQKMKEF